MTKAASYSIIYLCDKTLKILIFLDVIKQVPITDKFRDNV